MNVVQCTVYSVHYGRYTVQCTLWAGGRNVCSLDNGLYFLCWKLCGLAHGFMLMQQTLWSS